MANYWIGETGPELIQSPTGTTVVPSRGDTRIPLAKAALFITGCAVGGFGLGVFIAAVIGKRGTIPSQ